MRDFLRQGGRDIQNLFADFVVQQAVSVEASEGQMLSVTHYAHPFSVSAQTQVLALAE